MYEDGERRLDVTSDEELGSELKHFGAIVTNPRKSPQIRRKVNLQTVSRQRAVCGFS